MAEMRFSIRVLPVGVVVAALMVSGCEREISTGGDPRVDGIIQTALPEPDLSILGDQRNTKSTARSAVPAVAAPASAAASAPASAPASGPTPESAPAPEPAAATQATPPA